MQGCTVSKPFKIYAPTEKMIQRKHEIPTLRLKLWRGM